VKKNKMNKFHPVMYFCSGIATSLLGLCLYYVASSSISKSNKKNKRITSKDHLHWDEIQERRGLGNLLYKVNHIAITVSDVGKSLAFYTDILGLQQIRRPNFDRHGAWLTMGNLELHLIKGIPTVHEGDDLIVGHISFESENILLVLEKLKILNIPFKQNISVPDPEKSSKSIFEGTSTKQTDVVQFFVTDPDGYYIEICNCDILTDFCLGYSIFYFLFL
jgi:catechol 2,3-dioxygenase-like lactoylglutathione lyase family enzyme